MEARKNKKEKKWKTRKRKQPKGLGWMCIPVILALSRLKQKGEEFKASMCSKRLT